MKIVYFWVKEYLNIIDQGMNFGSEYSYNHIYDNNNNTIHLSRKKNPNFINDFFKIDNLGFSNVTAIVGENGTGKTNILGSISNNFTQGIFDDNIFIIEDSGKILIKKNNPDNSINRSFMNFTLEVEENIPQLHVEADFNFEYIFSLENIENVYYSPIYDFRSHIESSNYGINVSSSYLLSEDSKDDSSNLSTDFFDSVEFHKTSEVRRKLLFLKNLKQRERERFNKAIFLPKEVIIRFRNISIPFDDKLNEPYNLSINFRYFLEQNFSFNKNDVWGKEIDAITLQEGKAYENSRNRNENNELINIIRWKSYVIILKSLFAAVIRNADRSPGNSLLQEDFNKAIDKVNDAIFTSKLDYSTLQYQQNCNFETFLFTFLKNQKTFNSKQILAFARFTKKLIFENKIENWEATGDIKLKLSTISADKLLTHYEKLLRQHTRYSNVPMKMGFIEFNWMGMSSGEESFLNLFSRLHLAHTKILSETEEHLFEDSRKTYPKSIIVLIDEGEQGFHMQWQKEYVFNLTSLIPLIFKEGTELQLIFATHSPISLSDIPHHNIVFLKKDPLTNLPKVLKEDAIRSTFSANIHDLLINSFFMKDGFTGAFSQYKINELMKELLKENTKEVIAASDSASYINHQEYAATLISLVDEPILRWKLEELFVNKFSVNRAEENIQSQINYLNNRLKQLRSNDNNI